jgi:hypothetical protein
LILQLQTIGKWPLRLNPWLHEVASRMQQRLDWIEAA